MRKPSDWARAGAAGGVLLNLPLPLEVAAALRWWGYPPPAAFAPIWAQALVVAATLFILLLLVGRRAKGEVSEPAPAPGAIRPGGVLARAGAGAPGEVAAVVAEDHYCRVTFTDGRARLVHARFGDALEELAGAAGAQVRRGAWVADGAVRGAARVDRRWRLLLADGSEAAVSARHVAAVRARGWLARRAD